MALSLTLAAWGLRLAPLISSLLEAWSLWPVTIGRGPFFMDLVNDGGARAGSAVIRSSVSDM